MTYQIGGEIKFSNKFSAKVGIQPVGGYVGYRAFARNEKTGTYREVFGLSQEDGCFVDGNFEGSMIRHTHETKSEASATAWKAYRWLNK